MKKAILLLLFILIFVTGCGQGDSGMKEEPEVGESTGEETEALDDEKLDNDGVEEVREEKEETEVEIEVQKPLYKIDESTWSVVPIEDADEKIVLLTFDDAPDRHAVEIAHTLKELNVKAIFFVNGHFLDTEEEAQKLKEIYELGFPIGNHTYSHSNLKQISVDEQQKEIITLNDRVEEIIGERPKYFRAPFGVNTEDSKRIAASENMVVMNWTYGYDWEKDYQNKEALADIMVNSPYLRDGANLLMHDRTWTKDAIKDIVLGLQEKGYKIVDPAVIQTP